MIGRRTDEPSLCAWQIVQLPELFRRGVLVPADDYSAEQLARWSVDCACRVDYLAIPDEALFTRIWEAGILQSINRACSTMIDDYEEEVLPPEKLAAAIKAIDDLSGSIADSADLQVFVTTLVAMCQQALRMNRPVYFIT